MISLLWREWRKAQKTSFVVDQDGCLNYHNINDHFSWKDETRDTIGPICLSVVETGM